MQLPTTTRVLAVILLLQLCADRSSPGAGRALAVDADVVQRLWTGDAPGKAITGGPERDTSGADGRKVAGRPVIRLGNVSQPELHLYIPEVDRRTDTAVLICPGGGFSILAWDLEGTEVAEWLRGLGVTAAVLKYRVPTRDTDRSWQTPVMDAQRAVRLLRQHHATADTGITRVGILGFSAGGATAARAAVAGGRAAYEAVDEVDRQSAATDFAVLVYPAYLIDDNGALLPECQPTAETPPMFFAHAQNDRISCDNSIQLFRALRGAGVAGELHVYSDGGHGFGLRKTELPVSDWPSRCEAWMRLNGYL